MVTPYHALFGKHDNLILIFASLACESRRRFLLTKLTLHYDIYRQTNQSQL